MTLMMNGLNTAAASNNIGGDAANNNLQQVHENGDDDDSDSAVKDDEQPLDDESLPATQTAKRLKLSLQGLNTDETVIIDILATTKNAELQQVKSKYAELFDSELEEDLSAEIGGFFEELCLQLLQTPLQNEIETAHKALQRGPRHCHRLVEILMLKTSTSSAAEQQNSIIEFKAAYNVYYGKKIDYVVRDRLKGQLRGFVLWLLNGGRDTTARANDNSVDEVQAFDDAARLMEQLDDEYKQKVEQLPPSLVSLPSTDSVESGADVDDALFELLSVRDATHLRLVFQHFEQLTEKSIESAIHEVFNRRPRTTNRSLNRTTTKENLLANRAIHRHRSREEHDQSEELVKCLLIAVKIVRQGALSYFVDQIHDCFPPLSSSSTSSPAQPIDDDTIMRMFAQRKEIDLAPISAQYSVKYQPHSLLEQIKQHCFGDYGKLLQAILSDSQKSSGG